MKDKGQEDRFTIGKYLLRCAECFREYFVGPTSYRRTSSVVLVQVG